jgi:hypothetical protein
MTLEDLSRRVGTVLAMCSVGVLVTALLCAIGGAGAGPTVASLHHLFGLTLAVLGFVMFAVGVSLSSLVPPDWVAQKSQSQAEQSDLPNGADPA